MKRVHLYKSALTGVLSLFLGLGIVSCGKHEKPNFEYMPGMAYSPGYKAQEAQPHLNSPAMRDPVPGTVARGQEIYPFPNDPNKAMTNLRNPLPKTRQVLTRGMENFRIYCQVCHGPLGEGNGSVVPRYPAPPSLQSDKVRGWLAQKQDGAIYHIITMGQNRMPSYASQVQPEDRWAIVHYLRALHRAKNPSKSDLEELEKW